MGILRADRITGLGGANAITGSVFLGGKQRIVIDSHDDFNFSNNDFTLECWINFSGFDATGFDTIAWGGSDGTANTRSIQWDYKNSANELRLVTSVSDSGTIYASSFTALKDVWYHLAVCRSSSDLKLFVNGTQIGSTHNIGSNVIDYDTVPFNIGMRPGNDDRGVIGHISNFRIINGTALYTSNFSVPTTRLTSVTNTALLCCQSSGNIFEDQSLVKKKFTFHTNNTNDAPPMASHFTPNSPVGFSTTTDVGSQYGTTFDGFGSFATSTYMVPPGGNTRERNRGRAVFGGGESPTADNVMEYLNIQSGGRTIDFGDHSVTTPSGDAVASSTRGVFTVHNSPANTNALEFITIANTGNSIDFGDQNTGGISQEAAASNSTRGLFAGGIFPGSQVHDITEYITIATLGNAIDFGNLIATVTSNTGVADATRALFAGGIGPASPFPTVNRIEYFTIATTGNATDFGDLTFSARYPGSAGDSTRGVFMGGATPSAINTICFVTIQTTGDATDYGDLVTASHDIAATSNNTRAIMGGGGTPSRTNTIEQLTIQTNGNATDFGDLSRKVDQLGVCSDSHGGL